MNDYRYYNNEEPRQNSNGNGDNNLNAQLRVRKRSKQEKALDRRFVEMQDMSGANAQNINEN